MENEEIEQLKWKLTELSCADADFIDSNDYEIMGEDKEGRDGYCTVQVNKVAEDALAAITGFEQEVAELKAMVNELMEVVRKSHQTPQDSYYKDGINCLQFDVLNRAPQQSLATHDSEIEDEAIKRYTKWIKCTSPSHRIFHSFKRKYQLPTNEDQAGRKSGERHE